MNKFLLLGLLLASTLMVSAQTDSLSKSIQKRSEAIGHGGNNELKLNLLMTIIGAPEITYERLIGDNMGLGLTAGVSISEDDVDYKYIIMPHYRLYFGGKKANGFFIEGNAALMGNRDYTQLYYTDYYPSGGMHSRNWETKTQFGLGAAAGAKFLTRNGFLGEVYTGVGRVFGSRRLIEAYPRVGITIGKRF